jgi:hypothetical protein
MRVWARHTPARAQSPICELTAVEAKDQLVSADHDGAVAVWAATNHWAALWRVPAAGCDEGSQPAQPFCRVLPGTTGTRSRSGT